ncbi:ATP-binding cassette multidrug transporter [Dissoconium aciculare CBS 342.82]|uniref:ATP-binding cassette multidrug transporter n=1 Tax=Dissoconium aciculare CBS 342.82 TaxID=1314786 RepID=A0A6J3LZL3_9PEZI|nr:ATP-binding cassette multidrug transporter [Dissoconium aciculare CBS 342.82]KAF1820072.1 ATP-binding cassette multidrug transporter [Dissoconium aciculare CBS 342.82]
MDHELERQSNSSRRPSLTPSLSRTRSKSVSQGVQSSPAIPQTATIPELNSDHPTPLEQSELAKQGLEDAETPPAKFETSDDEYYAEENQTIADLALTLSRRPTFNNVPSNPFEAEKDSALDPHSPNFRAREWVKSMIKLNRDDGRTPLRTGGFAFRNFGAHGFGNATDYQKDVGNIWLETVGLTKKVLGLSKPRRIDILRDFEGVVESGEMLVVLGPPGSGCSTFLKALTGETHGFNVNDESYVNYQGIPTKKMHKYFRGEAIYTAEVDVHFPMMTVGDTLDFAARARAPRMIPNGYSKQEWSTHLRDVIMATFGISHTINTRVGNDYVRGVSGGERKRVTIAEAALSGAVIQAWDNSTRGLDSANAIEFCKSVRLSTELQGCAAMVAIYQAPQAAFDQFDKAIVLYEGRQIYFGTTTHARRYFENLGFVCPDRQTTADFLTSMTSSQERVVKEGFENRVPRTPDEFAQAWKESKEREHLLKQIDAYDKRFPFEGQAYQDFVESRKAQKSKQQRLKSPYTLSYPQQVQLCLWRGFKRLRADPSLTFSQLFGNFAMALVIGSVFYNLEVSTSSFYQRAAVLFFAILMNAFGSALEILTLYAQRPIVEKQDRYALYHPSAEAFASMLTDLPYKVLNAIVFNLTVYFMANLRREPGAFFFFVFISFILTLTMSMMFRTIASVSRTLSQAMAPAAIIILAIVIFTGFAIPVNYMLGWCRWINYIDPVAYGFEALMINEFSGRNYVCSDRVPVYGNLQDQTQVCSAVGSSPGLPYVEGANYIMSAYQYQPINKWRNVGIIFAFMIGLMFCYLAATELVSAQKSKGEVLVFRMGHTPASLKEKRSDEETADAGDGAALGKKETHTEATDIIQKQTAIFSWKDVCYDIKIKSEERRILDHVDGWVKPGTLTALMGVSGAGKTTLLDVLATRVTMGVITGDMLVDGRQRDSSFQRKTGYVQQQDLHLQTTTVREALNFSALLRQPKHVSRKEKLEYVDEVIRLLDMEEYADAVVGVPGEGLNVEQRKRLTIGVELAAKPELLLFLDEPTSGLDSQTSWAICDLMEKLKNSGQAILCTIHQPSAMLFQRFDRLLFLAKGGRTVYFGEIGENSHVLSSYFERNGSHACPNDANPAEWMLEVIGAAPGTSTDKDWHQIWRDSPEYQDVHKELERLKQERPEKTEPSASPNDKESYREFAAPFGTQLWEVTIRVFQQYWRTPSYIYSKFALCLLSSLFIGFIFYKSPLTHQGLQNQMLSIFMTFTIFGQLVQQIMPHFVTQRSLYEVRERPSKTYSWKAFMISNIVVELPWNSLMAVIMFFCYYYPVGLYNNAIPSGAIAERGALFFLFMWQFLLFTSTFTNMVIAGIDTAENGGNIANLMFTLTLIFCGVLATAQSLPGFWIFMYRLSPFTYFVGGFLATGLANTKTYCADNEFVSFRPANGATCRDYMQPYMSVAGGYLQDPNNTDMCSYCTYDDTNVFLAQLGISYGDRWRNFGIIWAYIIFNVFAAVALYWLVRMPKGGKKKDEADKKEEKKNKGEKDVENN